MLEANRDEAQKCCKLAKAAIVRKDYAKAIRLLNKANVMYPCDEFLQLLQECQAKAPASEPKSADANNQTPDECRDSSSTSHANGNVATSEQEALCRAVVTAKDYYKMFNVPRHASCDDIKRAYKKLALKLHPDKNPSQLASDAFKKISTAFQCLTDTNSRQHYDQYGEEPNATAVSNSANQETFITPEQLFEAFFGIHPSTTGSGSRRRHAHFLRGVFFRDTAASQNGSHRASSQAAAGSLTPLLPLIFMLLFFLLSSFLSRQTSVFQYHRSGRYNRMLSTNLNGVIYYVDGKTFEMYYPEHSAERLRIEYEIDYNYFDYQCNNERKRNQKKVYTYLATFQNPPKELYEAPKSCVILSKLKKVYSDAIRGYT